MAVAVCARRSAAGGRGGGGCGGAGALEEDASSLGAVRGRRSESAHHRRESPLFYIRLDEDEPCLAEVDVHRASRVGADGREEVVLVHPDVGVLKLLAVAGEEDGACARAVADAEDVAFGERRAVGLSGEGVRVRLEAVRREVADRVLVPACAPHVE